MCRFGVNNDDIEGANAEQMAKLRGHEQSHDQMACLAETSWCGVVCCLTTIVLLVVFAPDWPSQVLYLLFFFSMIFTGMCFGLGMRNSCAAEFERKQHRELMRELDV